MCRPPICSFSTDGRTDSFSPSIFSSSRNLFILGDFNCHHPLWDPRGTSDPRGEEVFDWVISSDLLPLVDPDPPTLLHHSSGSRSSSDISFAPSSIAISCSWEVRQDLGSDHLPILLPDPLTPTFCPNERHPAFNFQRAHWDDFSSYFDSHCPSADKYSSLSLSSTAALFTSLALNAAKSSIPFCRIKRHPKAWCSTEVEGAVSKGSKAFSVAHMMKIARLTSPFLDAPRQSSPRPRLKHCRRLALLLHPNQTRKLYTLFPALSLAFLPCLPPLLTFPNSSSTRKLASVYAAYMGYHFSVFQPKVLRSRARGYLSELRRATCLQEYHSSFYSPLSSTELLMAASNLSPSTAIGPDKVAYPMLKHLLRSASSHLQCLLVFAFLYFHLEDIFYYSHSHDGKNSRLSCFLPAYLSHLLLLKAF